MRKPELLSAEQQAVVDYAEGDLFVSACPGAGKTHTVVERFIDRCQRLPQNRGIGIISFSRIAATEVRKRCHERELSRLLGFPHFVGTFDSFFIRYLYMPLAQTRSGHRVRILDSWDSINACVQLSGSKAVQGRGVPLDAFSYDGQRAQFDGRRLQREFAGWRKKIEENRADWERAATSKRKSLKDAGLRSCEDVRVAVAKTFGDRKWDFMLQALAGRFCEVIVDEAQDCDEAQISVLKRIRDAGVRLVLVADVDQAIYEFRNATPVALLEFASTMHCLSIRGNRRGTPGICAVANSMVAIDRADMSSIGQTKDCAWPVRVIAYEPGAEREAGADFCAHARERGCREKLLVAHSRTLALKAAGLSMTSKCQGGISVALVQRAVRMVEGGLDSKARVAALLETERILLRRIGAKADDLTLELEDICLLESIERRWLRASTVAFLRTARRLIADREAITVGDAVFIARTAADSLAPPPGREWKRSAASIFKANGDQLKISVALARGTASPYDLTVNTVHGVKGGSADAVLFILSADIEAAKSLLATWRDRIADNEAKRVAYVGITRAKRLLGLAVPAELADELVNILRERRVDIEESWVCRERHGEATGKTLRRQRKS